MEFELTRRENKQGMQTSRLAPRGFLPRLIPKKFSLPKTFRDEDDEDAMPRKKHAGS